MTTARWAGALLALVSLAAGPAVAQSDVIQGGPLPAPSYDFVQQASSMTYDGTTMTLSGIAPATVFFSDRPYRMTGQLTNQQFVALWQGNGGTFVGDPPNAAVSVLSNTTTAPAIVELRSAALNGDSLSYDVTVLSGELPRSADNIALFIDRGHFGGGGFHGGGFRGGGFHGGGFHGGGFYGAHYGGRGFRGGAFGPPPVHHHHYYPAGYGPHHP
ncbi:MAG: hypothetical protein AAGJ94_18015, partial [Pseudomonadota bacterium]